MTETYTMDGPVLRTRTCVVIVQRHGTSGSGHA
jgi:hypothetical protein